jgi:outer membrane lipoprotein carrier protein
MFRFLILLLAAFALSATPAFAADAKTDLLNFLHQAKTLRMSFTQITLAKKNLTPQTLTGVLSVSRPGKFRWETVKPYPQLIVGSGDKVWFYDPDLEQVIERTNRDALGGTPAALLAGAAHAEDAFTLQNLPDAANLSWVGATPKDHSANFRQIKLGFTADGKLAQMELDDAFGQTILTTFTKVEENVALDAKLFQFTPPKGASIIKDTN